MTVSKTEKIATRKLYRGRSLECALEGQVV